MDSNVSPNLFLASLPPAEFFELRPHLRTVKFTQGATLMDVGSPVTQIYFPHLGLISLAVHLRGGESILVAVTGREGVIGAAAALDGGVAVTEAIVHVPGTASVVKVGQLRARISQSEALRDKLMRYERVLFVQAQQAAACNAMHDLESRLALWLLRMRDFSGCDTLPLTQDMLARMLGVRRSSISQVANDLQDEGIIHYCRGRIQITDTHRLERRVCECYEAVKSHAERLSHS